MKCRIKITSCSNPNLWYVDRIGQEFDVDAVGGRCSVEGNPIFKIKGADYKVIEGEDNWQKEKPVSAQIYEIIKKGSCTKGEVMFYYRRDYGYIQEVTIRRALSYLAYGKNLIVATKEKRRSHSERLQNIYSII